MGATDVCSRSGEDSIQSDFSIQHACKDTGFAERIRSGGMGKSEDYSFIWQCPQKGYNKNMHGRTPNNWSTIFSFVWAVFDLIFSLLRALRAA